MSPPRPLPEDDPHAAAGRTTTTAGEAAAVVAIAFGVAIASSLAALGQPAAPAAFTDAGLMSTMLMEVVLGLIVLGLLQHRGYALPSLLPRPTAADTVFGALLYLVVWLGGGALLSPVYDQMGPQPIDQMLREAHVSLPVVVLTALVNACYEEVLLLGFLMRGFLHRGASFALGLQVLVRLSYHLYQGPVGALWVALGGLLFGVVVWRTGRLWPAIAAHILWDVLPFADGNG